MFSARTLIIVMYAGDASVWFRLLNHLHARAPPPVFNVSSELP